MWTTINQTDYTNSVNLDLQLDNSINDQQPKLTFTLDDPGSTSSLVEGQEVIVWDETLTDVVSNIKMIPALNLLINADVFSSTSGVGSPWATAGTLAGIITEDASHWNVNMAFSNSALGAGFCQQQTLSGYIKPGNKYCFSYWVTAKVTLVNAQAVAQLSFLDGSGVQIGGSLVSDTFIPTVGNLVRRSVTATAPAGAVYALVQLGGQTTVGGTNSGTIQYGNATATNTGTQLEPVMFATSQGISYPTPDLGFYIVGSGAVMPDSTISRRCRIFAGWIDHLEARYEGTNRTWTVECTSASAVLEMVNLLSVNYSTPTYDSTIITTIVTASYSGILATGQLFNTGPTSSVIQGLQVNEASYADQSFREILNALIDASGFTYYVDPYYYLHYQPSYWDVAAITISDSPDNVTSFAPIDYWIERDITTIKNRIKVVGASMEQPAITDTFNGNGATKVFTLSQIPHNVTACSVGGTSKKGGVNGINTYSQGYDYLYDRGSQQITWNVAPVSGTNNVSISYTYENPVSVVVESLASYAQYGRWYDSKVNDSTITSTTAAINRGLAELSKYAFAQVILHLSLNQYLLPGQVVFFTSARDNYSNQPFIVQQMTGHTLGSGVNEYDYQLGPYMPTLVDHVRNTSKAANRSRTVANATTAVQTDIVISETILYSESVSYTTATNPTYVYGTAYYGVTSFT